MNIMAFQSVRLLWNEFCNVIYIHFGYYENISRTYYFSILNEKRILTTYVQYYQFILFYLSENEVNNIFLHPEAS